LKKNCLSLDEIHSFRPLYDATIYPSDPWQNICKYVNEYHLAKWKNAFFNRIAYNNPCVDQESILDGDRYIRRYYFTNMPKK